MKTKRFPIKNRIPQIPIEEFQKIMEAPMHYQITFSAAELEVSETEDCDLDFREHDLESCPSNVQKAYTESLNTTEKDFVNL